jgi:hypothetical protein
MEEEKSQGAVLEVAGPHPGKAGNDVPFGRA